MRERIIIVVYFTMALQRDNRLKVSALFRARHKVREVTNLVGVSRTTVNTIKKRMDDGKGVKKRAGSGRKTVLDRDSLRNAIRGSALLAGCHSRHSLRDTILGTTVFSAIFGHLKYTTIKNHSHRASGRLNKSRIMTAKQPEL